MRKFTQTAVIICSIGFAIAFTAVTAVILCKKVDQMGRGKEEQKTEAKVKKPSFSEELNKASKAPREVPEFLKKKEEEKK